jgi:hypothetical protein
LTTDDGKRLFVRGSKEEKEYLETHPAAKRRAEKKAREYAKSIEELYKPVEEFKDKVRKLGQKTMEVEKKKVVGTDYAPYFHSEHYQMSLLELAAESYAEQMEREEGRWTKHWFLKMAERYLDDEMEKEKRNDDDGATATER